MGSWLKREAPFKDVKVNSWIGIGKPDVGAPLCLWVNRLGTTSLKPSQELRMLKDCVIPRPMYPAGHCGAKGMMIGWNNQESSDGVVTSSTVNLWWAVLLEDLIWWLGNPKVGQSTSIYPSEMPILASNLLGWAYKESGDTDTWEEWSLRGYGAVLEVILNWLPTQLTPQSW